MSRTYKDRTATIMANYDDALSLVDRIGAMVRLIRLMGYKGEVTPKIVALLQEAADKIQALETAENMIYLGRVDQKERGK